MDRELLISILRERGLINFQNIDFEPLAGGVSSDIYRVSDGMHTYVVKQALPKLQVEDDWYADVARNNIEQDFIHFLQDHIPKSVPKVLYSDSEHCFFVMEYLNDAYQNWKQQLLNGRFEASTAEMAADLLAEIHLQSWDDDELRQTFNNAANFYSLRTEPYLITTGKRHPALKEMFFDEARRLERHREALVHGDFSPKNIMVKGDRVVILDHEVAWFGDPAFDLAFFLNHLYLKMLFHVRNQREIKDLTKVVWNTYFREMGKRKREQMEPRVGRLLLLLMLARVDGKSPVEYLGEQEQEFVRSFVHKLLPRQIFTQSRINANWKSELKGSNF